jgi:redox-sensing transcriptional repressor
LNTPSPQPDQVPRAVVGRLSLYLRELQQLVGKGKQTVSSRVLGTRLGVTDAQVRKDFTYFGQFGYPGVGYRCRELITEIKRILGTDQTWPVALIGCGNLGQALLGYRGFEKQGFQVVGAFDVSPVIIGTKLADLTVRDIETLPEWVAQEKISLAILAVPADKANQAVEVIVRSGVTGILNFAPVTLKLPKRIQVIGVDLAIELEQLAFGVAKVDRS